MTTQLIDLISPTEGDEMKPLTTLTTPDEYARINRECAECIGNMTPDDLIEALARIRQLARNGIKLDKNLTGEILYQHIAKGLLDAER
jgi:hypothetical protein